MPTWPTNAAHFVPGCRLGKDATPLGKSHTAAHMPKQGLSILRSRQGLELPSDTTQKEQPKEADVRLWRVSASFGAAAPLGCATLLRIYQVDRICCKPALIRSDKAARCLFPLLLVKPHASVHKVKQRAIG